jgi:RNA polymerase sigma-70 factor (ECF subfamily)
MMTAAARTVAGRDLDEVTLRRAQRGEAGAFRELVERYHRAIWELAVRMLAGTAVAHRAEDVVQETFVRVHRALPSFDPAGPARLSTWILTIASRLALNELRVAPRAAATVPIEQMIDTAAADSPVRAAEVKQRARAIAAALGELPEQARAVIVLREYHDLDYEEIARVLEIDLGTVKSRLSRARALLRERLGALAPGGDHA